MLDRLPRMLGADDDPTGFEPLHQPIADAWRRHRHWRLGATDLVMESLVPTIIEQKVTGQEALRRRSARMVHRFGERAPGPPSEADPPVRLWVQPSPERAARDPVVGVAAAARRRCPVPADPARRAGRVRRSSGPAARRPRSSTAGCARCPGIGVWTSAEVRSRALGDADAVSFGDYHIATNVGYVLTGEPVDDDGLAALLEPYAGHRHRVQRLVELAGLSRPRRGPRMAPGRTFRGVERLTCRADPQTQEPLVSA